MRIHIYTEKDDYIKVIGLLCDGIHHDIEVCEITECQLANMSLSRHIDLLIFDDRLYSETSKEALKILADQGVRTIVFLMEKKHIDRYMALDLIDYFASPLNWENINSRLRESHHQQMILRNVGDIHQNKLVIKTANEIYILKHTDIFYIERNQKLTKIHTQRQVYECQESLKKLISRLPESFIRTHSSYIVNFDNAKQVVNVGNKTYHVTFEEVGEFAVLSRKRSEELLDHAINHFRLSFIDGEKKG